MSYGKIIQFILSEPKMVKPIMEMESRGILGSKLKMPTLILVNMELHALQGIPLNP
jgi:hypothetical protein